MVRRSLDTPLKVSFTSAEFQRSPGSTFEYLRDAGPVVPIKIPLVGRTWMATTYAANEELAKSNESFVQEGRNAGKSGVAGFSWWMPRTLKLLTDNMLLKDEPEHRRLRKVVDHAFQRRDIAAMRPDVVDQAHALIDRFPAQGEFDIVATYARQLPLAVICSLLGLPEADREKFIAWSSRMGTVTGPISIFRMMGGLKQMVAYLRLQIEAARAGNGDGLIRHLVSADLDENALSESELLAMVLILLVAGFETTTHLIAGGLYTLSRHADAKAWLMAAPESRMERAVEELLRYWTPVQNTKPRFVAKDMEFHGQSLKRGDLIMAHLGAANYDADVFVAPDTLDLDRFPNPHLAFSSGIHFCLGLQLARIEAQVAIEALLARRPDLVVVQPTDRQFLNRIGLRGFKSLNVREN